MLVSAHMAALGADVTIPSRYDADTDTWIGDVDELTNRIVNASANQKIYLSRGVYDLSPLTNAPLYAADGSGYGAALIYANKDGVKFIGETGKPEDVVLKAVDSDYRLICLNASNSGLYNLTVMGGNASSAHINGYNYRRGGGVMMSGGSTVISNCVFTGNKAAVSGGAVAGPNGLNGTVYDSVFYGNNDSRQYALAANLTTLRNCIFTNNVSSSAAKNDWSGSIAEDCRVYDSYFAYNRASRTGGVSGGLAENCTFMFNSSYNVNGNNWGNPGGGGAYGAALTNCTFYGNTAYRIGGAIRGGTVVNCTVVSNSTMYTDAYGGGIYAANLVEGCTVVSNISVKGGGLNGCTLVVDTEIMYNAAYEGGGARTSALTGCTVAHNVAKEYGSSNYGGAGGGIAYGAATNCVFRDNSCSVAYATTCLKGCDLGDTSINAGVIDSCVIRDVRNESIARAIGNVSYPDGFVTSNIFMLGGVQLMRNCLVTNCTWKSISGTFVNSAMFTSGGAITTRVENCTFADNNYYLLSRHFNSETHQLVMKNSVLVGNKHSYAGDLVSMESAYLVLSNCVYGKLGSCTAKADGFENFGCTSITARADYKFADTPAPYSLKRTSPLRGWGLVEDWMADGTDLAGNPRLRDGKADIGCYQCWIMPVGSALSIR